MPVALAGYLHLIVVSERVVLLRLGTRDVFEVGEGLSHLDVVDVVVVDQVSKGTRLLGSLLHSLHGIICLLVLPAVLLKPTPSGRNLESASLFMPTTRAPIELHAIVINRCAIVVRVNLQELVLVSRGQRLRLYLSLGLILKLAVLFISRVLLKPHLDGRIDIFYVDSSASEILGSPEAFVLLVGLYRSSPVLHRRVKGVARSLLIVIWLN